MLYEGADEDVIEISLDVGAPDQTVHKAFRFAYDRESDRLQDPSIENAGLYPDVSPIQSPKVTYISADRLGPRKTLPLSESRARTGDLGVQGQFVLHLLLENGTRPLIEGDPRLRAAPSLRLSDQVDAWLQEISPGCHLEFEAVRAADLAISGFKFDREGDVSSRRFRATNVGFGLSYVLPVVVGLLACRPESLVIVENPEAHLHPKGQTRLGQLAARAAASGSQVIIETHSDHFMDGVRIEVREGRLQASDTAFHYFIRTGIEATVISPIINADGRLSEWPAGFFDQHDENLAKLLTPRS